MNPIEKIIEYWLKRNSIATLAIILFVSIFLLILGDGWIQNNLNTINLGGINISITEGIFYNIILFLILALLVFLFLLIYRKFLYFYSILVAKIFQSKTILIPPISKWKFQGSLKINNNSFSVTSSDLGCLLDKYLYKNFIMNFNLKIINGGRAGIIFRAQDLENYLMLQIELADYKSEKTIIYDIVPYIRTWADLENFRPYFRLGEGFLHKYRKLENNEIEEDGKKLSYNLEKGLDVELKVKDNMAIIKVFSNDKIEEFCWDIPTHTKPNIFSLKRPPLEKPTNEAGLTVTQEDIVNDGKVIPEQKSASEVWFRNKYGKIGFRADNLEKAIITDLKIEKI